MTPEEPEPGPAPAYASPFDDDVVARAFGLSRGSEEWKSHVRRAAATPMAVVGDLELLRPLGGNAYGMLYAARERSGGAALAVRRLAVGKAAGVAVRVGAMDRLALGGFVPPGRCEMIDGRHYLVRPWAEGLSLDAHADRVRGSHPEALRGMLAVLARVADGVAAAHRAGIILGRLKPENVIVGSDGAPRVLDAELACVWSEEREPPPPPYARPAASAGASASIDDDLYAIGAVLFRVLTGSEPGAELSGDDPALASIADRATRERARAIIARAALESAGGGYPSALALADDLARAAREGVSAVSGVVDFLRRRW